MRFFQPDDERTGFLHAILDPRLHPLPGKYGAAENSEQYQRRAKAKAQAPQEPATEQHVRNNPPRLGDRLGYPV